MSNNTYKIEYAKSGRSSCKAKGCKGTIDKENIRIAKVYPSARFEDDGVAQDYFHPQCLFDSQLRARKTTKKVEDVEDLEGFDELSKKDQASIKKMLEDHLDSKGSKGKSAKKKVTKPKPKTTSQLNDFFFHGSDDEEKSTSSSTPIKNKNNNNGSHHTPSSTTTPSSSTTHKQADIKSALSSRWSKSFDSDYLSKFGIDTFLGPKRNDAYLPNNNMVFSALNAVPSAKDVSVIILGQSPSPKRENASGFSYCDNNAQSWRLDKCKVTTRNLIKAALRSKGWISKDDDIETVQEALKEVDLPTDSAKDWFKATARQGVLWLNTALTCTEDKEDDRKPHEQIWHPFVEEIIRVIFNSKINDSGDIKGVVFLLLGKHFIGWKQIIEKVHAEVMGVVPIEFVDGVSPVLETFHNVNYLVEINKMLARILVNEIDWFPSSQNDDDYDEEEEEEEEEEEKMAEVTSTATNKKTSPPLKSAIVSDEVVDELFNTDEIGSGMDFTNETKPKVTEGGSKSSSDDVSIANLLQEDGSLIKLSDGVDITLGRQSLQIRDVSVSRKQLSVVAKRVGQHVEVELTPLGTNQSHLIKYGTEDAIPLNQGVAVKIKHGDTFLLCSQKYPFRLEIPSNKKKNQSSSSSAPTTPTKPPVSHGSSSPLPSSPSPTLPSSQSSTKPYTPKSKAILEKKDEEYAKRLQEEDELLRQREELLGETGGSAGDSKKRKKTNTTTKSEKPKPKKKTKKNDDEEDFMDEDDIFEDDDDDEYIPDEDYEDDGDYVPPKTRAQSKPKCMYWDKCYRQNPEHLKQFRHPSKN